MVNKWLQKYLGINQETAKVDTEFKFEEININLKYLDKKIDIVNDLSIESAKTAIELEKQINLLVKGISAIKKQINPVSKPGQSQILEERGSEE